MDSTTLIIGLVIVLICLKKLLTPSINPYRFSRIKKWAEAGNYFNFQGYPIFYYDSIAVDSNALSKPCLLLLHGYPTSSFDWLSMKQNLEEKFRIIAPDYIGYGLSAKPIKFNYSIRAQADMIESLLKSLILDKYHFMAHDVGVTIAQELLARQLDQGRCQILSSVFLNGGLFPETHRPFIMMRILKTPIIGAVMQFLMPRRTFHRAFNRVFGPQTQRNKNELDEVTDLLFYNAPYNLLQQLQCYINERYQYRDRWVGAMTEVQKRFGVPMRLINGPYDPISGKHMVERYREVMKNPDACVLADHIGHYPNMEDPTNTLKHFFDFHRLNDQ